MAGVTGPRTAITRGGRSHLCVASSRSRALDDYGLLRRPAQSHLAKLFEARRHRARGDGHLHTERVVRREARVEGQKRVKSSTATLEKRYVIITPIIMDGYQWDIQLTLTDRSEMTYLMLLGREAMRGQFIVDPEHDFLLTGKD